MAFNKLFKSVFSNYIKLNIKLLHFTANTTFGFGLYLVLTLYTYLGYKFSFLNWSHYFCAFFILYVLFTIVMVTILFKISLTRQWIGNLVGNDFIEKYLGK